MTTRFCSICSRITWHDHETALLHEEINIYQCEICEHFHSSPVLTPADFYNTDRLGKCCTYQEHS